MGENKIMPNGWELSNLQDAVDVLDNLRKPINSDERVKRIFGKEEGELYPYYGATGQVGWIDEFITDGEYVLVGEDGAPFLDFYKPKAYLIKGKTWVNNHAHILRFKEGVTINAFILHFLNQFNFDGYVNGTTRLKLTKSKLVEIPFPVPPLTEQHRIVAKIEELFSSLDKGIESLKTAQQQLKVYRQAVLKWAFEGKLTEEWRRGNTNKTGQDVLAVIKSKRIGILKDRISKGNKESSLILNKITKHKFNNPNTAIPTEWRWTSFLNACFLVVDCHNKTAPYTEKGIYLIRTSNIKNGMLSLSENIKYVSNETDEFWSRRCQPESGDILFTREAPMGDAAIIPDGIRVCMGQRIMLLRTFPDLLLPKYLHYAILDSDFQKRMNENAIGTGVKHLRVGDVEGLMFPICTTLEQHTIVAEIESRLSVCDKIEETIEQSLKQAESLRQSILKKAFEGKLVPQDPNDEPASVLLARIKAEREKNKSENPPPRRTGKTKKAQS